MGRDGRGDLEMEGFTLLRLTPGIFDIFTPGYNSKGSSGETIAVMVAIQTGPNRGSSG